MPLSFGLASPFPTRTVLDSLDSKILPYPLRQMPLRKGDPLVNEGVCAATFESSPPVSLFAWPGLHPAAFRRSISSALADRIVLGGGGGGPTLTLHHPSMAAVAVVHVLLGHPGQ